MDSKCLDKTAHVKDYVTPHIFRSLEGAFSLHYENTPILIYRKFHHQNLKFSDKISDIFSYISAQNIDCGYSLEPPRRGRGGSNEYPQSIFWAEIRKIMYTPINPNFTI